jgi:hypothetical protein
MLAYAFIGMETRSMGFWELFVPLLAGFFASSLAVATVWLLS